MRIARVVLTAALASLACATSAAIACSTCGCTLSSDWSSQGLAPSGEGFRFDFRFDYFNQDQLRSGTKKVDRGSLEIPSDREIQQSTINRNYTLGFDYSPSLDWGVNVQLPFFNRSHATIAEGDTEVSTSHTQSIGDLRLVGRYLGFTADRDIGVQLGVKFPTGSFDNAFISGPQEGEPLDRGLQPGTGTTDLLLGAFTFGELAVGWDWFAQAMLQQPLHSRDGFRPGTGFNVNGGFRYVGFEGIVPSLQVNVRIEGRESGPNADTDNSGSTLAYVSPGINFTLTEKLHGYLFAQVPVYQRVNGLQIEPRYTVTAGVYFTM
ncbi:MAG TPA: hypothetical protein PLW68_12395 [Casimicrobiaceae bacterium]|nr:hypothetical protein [Casimicrobiaceae bacterium]